MQDKLISIIVPIYNIPTNYFTKCLESLVNQTINNQIEVILIDDGSINGCEKICDEYSIKYNNIKVIHQKNQGVSIARNAGIKIAKGQWIMFVDPDDWVEKNICEELIKYAKDNIDIIISSCNECYKNKKIKISTFDKDYIEFNKNDTQILQLHLISNEVLEKEKNAAYLGTPWAKLYRTSFIRENDLSYKEGIKRGQDVIFNLYCFEKAKKIIYTKNFLYNYRKCLESATNKHDKIIIENYSKYMEEELKFIQKYNKANIFYEAYNIRTLKFISEIINKYAFKSKILSYKEGKTVLKSILEKEDIKNSLYKINTKNLSVYQKLLLNALKKQKYFIIKIITVIRNIIKKLRKQDEKNMY